MKLLFRKAAFQQSPDFCTYLFTIWITSLNQAIGFLKHDFASAVELKYPGRSMVIRFLRPKIAKFAGAVKHCEYTQRFSAIPCAKSDFSGIRNWLNIKFQPRINNWNPVAFGQLCRHLIGRSISFSRLEGAGLFQARVGIEKTAPKKVAPQRYLYASKATGLPHRRLSASQNSGSWVRLFCFFDFGDNLFYLSR
jgi:hypothetical protein